MNKQNPLLIPLFMPGRSYPSTLGLKLVYYYTEWLNLNIKRHISPQISCRFVSAIYVLPFEGLS
jgi:hypothetical protein